MPTVTSSVLRRIEFDDLTHELRITFVTGTGYVYYGVPRDIYQGLLRAESKGAFFNEQIRDRYRFKQTS